MDEGLPAATLTSNFGKVAADQAWVRVALETTVGGVVDSLERDVFGGLGIGRITISASMTALKRMPRGIQDLFPRISDLKGTGQRQTVTSVWMRTTSRKLDLIKQTIAREGPRSARWKPLVRDDFIRLGLGQVATAGLVSAAFQVGEDWPRMQMYGLTGGQMFWRAATVGSGAAAGTLVVMALLCSASPPAWVTIPFVIFFAAAYERGVTPWVYETMGLYGRYEFRPQGRRLDAGLLGGRRTLY